MRQTKITDFIDREEKDLVADRESNQQTTDSRVGTSKIGVSQNVKRRRK